MLNPALKVVLLPLGVMVASCAVPDTGLHASRVDPVALQTDVRTRIVASSSGEARLDVETEPAGATDGAVATLTYDGRIWRVTQANCRAFRVALEAWRAFPPIRPAPPALRDDPPATQIPPISLHGFGDWTFETEASVPDSYPVTVTIRDSGGRYTQWAERTVRGIMSCPDSESQ